MKPIRDIIVKVDHAYAQTIKTESGFELLRDENIKQVKDTIRHGEVVALPDNVGWDIQVGDELYFHHNIVGVTVMEDTDVESQYLIDREQNLYAVPTDKYWPMAFAILRDGEFKALDGVCFVRPIVHKKYHTTNIIVPDNETELQSIGEMVHSNDNLRIQGAVEGSKVIFEKDSEYKFDVNGETLYCMFDRWILGVYEGQQQE